MKQDIQYLPQASAHAQCSRALMHTSSCEECEEDRSLLQSCLTCPVPNPDCASASRALLFHTPVSKMQGQEALDASKCLNQGSSGSSGSSGSPSCLHMSGCLNQGSSGSPSCLQMGTTQRTHKMLIPSCPPWTNQTVISLKHPCCHA